MGWLALASECYSTSEDHQYLLTKKNYSSQQLGTRSAIISYESSQDFLSSEDDLESDFSVRKSLVEGGYTYGIMHPADAYRLREKNVCRPSN